MESSGRFFLCARCRAQVLVCSDCDRGQIYCAGDCAPTMRRESIRQEGRRYQRSRRGRFKHAERMRRYRARQENVTHQGSPAPAADDLLAVSSTPWGAASSKVIPPTPAPQQCHFCGRPCSTFVRIGPLRHRAPRIVCPSDRGGPDRDHSP